MYLKKMARFGSCWIESYRVLPSFIGFVSQTPGFTSSLPGLLGHINFETGFFLIKGIFVSPLVVTQFLGFTDVELLSLIFLIN